MTATDCLFCNIVGGQIPARKVYEDNETLAFLDIHPVNRGHTLVIPKRHCKDLMDMPPDLSAPLVDTLQRVGRRIVKTLGVSGFNVVLNNGSVAGQVIFHLHFHVIPRWSNDGLSFHPLGKTFSEEEMKTMEKLLAGAV